MNTGDKMKKFRSLTIAILIVVLVSTTIFAKERATITLGQDLNEADKNAVLKILDYEENDQIIYITNAEERKYLGQWVSPEILGSIAISSSSVRPQAKGSGIDVSLYNITWVTKDMVISALTTAGVEDADVKIAAPFAVSGTAALTGVLKGFEDATGKNIDEFTKEVANEELAKTGELGEAIGLENASVIVTKAKEEVIKRGLNDPEEIKILIKDIANEYNINLTDEQINSITELLTKISKMDIDFGKLQNQLKNVSNDLKKAIDENEEVKNFLTQILEWFKGLVDRIIAYIKE